MKRIFLVYCVAVAAACSAQEKKEPEAPWTPEERMQELEARITLLERVVSMLSDELLVTDGRYMIKRGDTGFKIARRFELTMEDLTRMNPDIKWDHLEVCRIIAIKEKKPNHSPEPTPSAVH